MPELQRDRARLQYLRRGRGPAVLLIQGSGVPARGWQPQIEGLADRFDLIAFDNPGIGGSTFTGPSPTIESMAADALAITDAEECERFHVVGHSMGGLIAQQIALTAPERVRSLALLCTFARGPQAARLSLAMVVTALRIYVGTRPMRRQAFTELVMPAPYLASVDRAALGRQLSDLFERDLANQPAIAMTQLKAMAKYDAFGRLASLGSIPTLVAAAAYDRIALPAYGRELAAAIPGARYIELADGGHAVTIQCAEQINALLAEHFSSVEAAQTSGLKSGATEC
ncbi:MAG: alpha/beta fold hydrolase [Acidobacteriota bacterium]